MSDKQDAYKGKLTGISYIDDSPLLRAVCAPLSKEVGQCDQIEENETFDAIDTEMMKRGTLAHASIRWEWVCEQSAILMETEAKDFRLLLFIIQSLSHTEKYGVSLPLAVEMFSRFSALWGESAYPEAKARGILIKKIADALIYMTEQTSNGKISADLLAFSAQKLRQCAILIKSVDAPKEAKLLSLANHLDAKQIKDTDSSGLPSLEKLLKEPTASKSVPVIETVKNSVGAQSSSFTIPLENLALDNRNERALKQSLTAVADFILELDVANPLSYRLRRFAAWHRIKDAPERKRREDSKTVIMPVSTNALDEYRAAAMRGQMDLDIVLRLERSCCIQPFWIEGQYIAYKLAVACGRVQAAAAIYEETSDFVVRTPWLAELQFSDGNPFLPNDVKLWLEHYQKSNVSSGYPLENEMIDSEKQIIFRSAKELAAQGNMQEAIVMLEGEHPSSDTPRSQALWEMMMMETLCEWGLQHLVSMQAVRLEECIKNMPVCEFEPDLIKRIKLLVVK